MTNIKINPEAKAIIKELYAKSKTIKHRIFSSIDHALFTEPFKIGLKDWIKNKPVLAIIGILLFLLFVGQIILDLSILILKLVNVWIMCAIIFVYFIFSLIPGVGQYYEKNMRFYRENTDDILKRFDVDPSSVAEETKDSFTTELMNKPAGIISVFQGVSNLFFVILTPVHGLIEHIFPMIVDLHFQIPDVGLEVSIWPWIKFLLICIQGIIYFLFE